MDGPLLVRYMLAPVEYEIRHTRTPLRPAVSRGLVELG